ncbi:unnamed protein product, partial [marine sediment metagenome]
IESPRITSEILISHILSIPKTKLYLKLDDFISKDEFEKFWSLVVARSNNIPIQYLTQEVSFLDLKLFIKEGVFIPRPETEILAQKAISILKNMSINEDRVDYPDFAEKAARMVASKELKMGILICNTAIGMPVFLQIIPLRV